MINCEHESLLPRCTTASAASCRRRSQSGPRGRAVCGLGGDHQTLPQSPARNRSRRTPTHHRTPCGERSGVTGRSVKTARSVPRCHTRSALPDVGRTDRHQGESCQHHAGQAGAGLDTKKTRTALFAGNLSCSLATWNGLAEKTFHIGSHLFGRRGQIMRKPPGE